MADFASELKKAITAGIKAEIERDRYTRSASLPNVSPTGGNPLGGAWSDSPTIAFATGYNSGTGLTTLGFTFDLSALDGTDQLL